MCKISALIFALTAASAATAATEKEPVAFEGEWSVSIAADGTIEKLESRKTLMPAVAGPVEKEIHTWKFLPGTLNGKPALTQTTLYLSMVAVQDDGDHVRIHFKEASTGPHYAKVSPPKYPESAIEAHRGGAVLLQVSFDGEGKVVDAIKAEGAPKAPVALVKSALASVKTWTFAPEIVGGQGVAGHALVPFCFTVGPVGSPPGECKWKEPRGGQEHSGYALAAIDPVAQLLTKVTDRTL